MKKLVMNLQRIGIVALSIVTLLLAACGGGDNVAGGGIGGSGVISSGQVTATGSIFVNGVEYRVQDAVFTREDETPIILDEAQAQIVPGMVVVVEGNLDPGAAGGQAVTVRYEDLVEGEIDGLLASSAVVKVVEILGQEVVVENGLTRFAAGLGFAAIEVTAGMIEVSGYRRDDGRIQATYLESRGAAGRLEVKGLVTVLDATRFSIEGLVVNYDGIPVLADGDLVEVKGATYVAATRTLTAATVEKQSRGLASSDKPVAEVEGYVSLLGTSPVPAGEAFLVDGQPVVYDATTVFVGGVATDMLAGSKVEAEGPLAAGLLSARRIEFKEGLRLEAEVLAVAGSSVTLAYPDGQSVQVMVDSTTTEGASALPGIQVGDYVRVRGEQLGSAVLATRLRNDGPGADDKFILQGPVDSFDATPGSDQLTLLGVTVLTSGFNDSQFVEAEISIGRDAFYTALAASPNMLVRMRGDGLLMALPSWSEAELER